MAVTMNLTATVYPHSTGRDSGTRAREDDGLLGHLAANRIALEMCPFSNLRTGVVASPADLPIRQFMDRGIPVTFNTDDPAMFGTDLVNEYLLAAKTFGLARAQILHLGQNAIRAAFLSEEEKLDLLSMMPNEPPA
jgi:adenosine deaminase